MIDFNSILYVFIGACGYALLFDNPQPATVVEQSRSVQMTAESAPVKMFTPERETIPKRKREPLIRMHSSDSCGPCRQWIAEKLPQWREQGWNVEIVKETDTVKGWPWFEVLDSDGDTFEVRGPLTKEKFFKSKESFRRVVR